MLVSFKDYRPAPRNPPVETPWITIKIEESLDGLTNWVLIDSFPIDPVDADPSKPAYRSFSSENAAIPEGWYRITFLDADGNQSVTEPTQYAPTEILASLDDINANLDNNVVRADLDNTALLQKSVARTIRANLSQIIDTASLFGWITPDTTPDTIREIAAKMIAGQLYMQEVSRSEQLIPDEHFGVRKYQEGLNMLGQVVSGDITIPAVITTPTDALTSDDFWPNDATDRAFTMGMEL